MDDQTVRLILDIAQSSKDATDFKGKIDEVGVSFKKADDGAAKLAASQKDAAKASAEMQRGFLSLTNAAQDFQAAGLNGILNNIPQIVTQFGGTAGLAAAIGGVAVACYAGTKAFNALWAAVVDGSNEVPKSADALARLSGELDTAKKRMKELADQGTLTNKELAEFNKLTAESAKLEAEAASAKEAAAARKQKSPNQSALGAAVGKLTGGPDFDKVIANAGSDPVATAAARADLERQLKEQEARVAKLPPNVAVQKNGQWENTPNPLRQGAMVAAQGLREKIASLVKNAEGWNKDAEELVTKARNGDMDAYDELLQRTTGDVHDQLAAVDPRNAGLKAAAQAGAKGRISDAIGDVVQPIISGLKGRRQAEKRATDQDKAIDAFSDEGGKESGRILKKQDADAERQRAKGDAASAKEYGTNARGPRAGVGPLYTSPDHKARNAADDEERRQRLKGAVGEINQGLPQDRRGGYDQDLVKASAQRMITAMKKGGDPMAAINQAFGDVLAMQQESDRRVGQMMRENAARAKRQRESQKTILSHR